VIGLPDDLMVPLFSRSVILPNGYMFLCGGRTDANSDGLRDNWLVKPDNNWSWEANPPMIYGHSNHYIAYINNDIYVVAG